MANAENNGAAFTDTANSGDKASETANGGFGKRTTPLQDWKADADAADSALSAPDDLDDLDGFDYLDDEESDSFVPIRQPRVKRGSIVDLSTLAEPEASDERAMTYKPSRHEAGWLGDSLSDFWEQNQISDVLYLVKGGKEANVYCCLPGPGAPPLANESGLLAAKVYRPRAFRNLRNDRMYREGRAVLTGDGRPVKATDTRILRAMGKKTDFGVQVQHSSWLLYEYTTLQKLHALGALVPQPVAAGENAVLMGFFGDRHAAAPTLSEMGVSADEAASLHLFRQIMATIEALLQIGMVHGDLSAYNVLCWNDDAAVIDFPQVMQIGSNPHAPDVLRRDLERICDYFRHMDVPDANADAIFARLWAQYGAEE